MCFFFDACPGGEVVVCWKHGGSDVVDEEEPPQVSSVLLYPF